MNFGPNIFLLTPEFVRGLSHISCSPDGRNWYPARPLAFASVFYRLKATWLVFTGRADALIWPEDYLKTQQEAK